MDLHFGGDTVYLKPLENNDISSLESLNLLLYKKNRSEKFNEIFLSRIGFKIIPIIPPQRQYYIVKDSLQLLNSEILSSDLALYTGTLPFKQNIESKRDFCMIFNKAENGIGEISYIFKRIPPNYNAFISNLSLDKFKNNEKIVEYLKINGFVTGSTHDNAQKIANFIKSEPGSIINSYKETPIKIFKDINNTDSFQEIMLTTSDKIAQPVMVKIRKDKDYLYSMVKLCEGGPPDTNFNDILNRFISKYGTPDFIRYLENTHTQASTADDLLTMIYLIKYENKPILAEISVMMENNPRRYILIASIDDLYFAQFTK